MTVELLDEAVEDAETVAIAWLEELRPGATASIRRSGDPLPFTLVTHIDGSEDVDGSYADPVISVHTLCDKALGAVAARDEAKDTHRRMLLLARFLENIQLPDGRFSSVDYVKVFSMPRWEPYGDDQILRKVGRYVLGFSYSAAA